MDQDRIYSGASPVDVRRDLAPLVEFEPEGMSGEALRALLQEKLRPHLMRYDLPGFQSMFNCVPEEGAKLGAAFAMDFNQGVTNWQVSPGGATLEELCCEALCRLFRLGPDAGATFMYSGTYANQQAVYLGLHRYAERCGFDLAQKGVAGFGGRRLGIAMSCDTHFSLRHAARMLGIGEESLVMLPVDRQRRLNVDALRAAIESRRQKQDVFCVVASAGTTSTGAIDPITPIADTCEEKGIWLHVDGAYGFPLRLLPEYEERLAGLNRADSICWDPHKQLGVPIPNSLLFVKKSRDFERMAVQATYFNRGGDGVPNPGLKSPPATRPMAALSLVTSLRLQGIKRVADRLLAPVLAIRSLASYLADVDGG